MYSTIEITYWLPNSLANTDCVETLLALFKRSSWEFLSAIETVEINKELTEIGLNEVCDKVQREHTVVVMSLVHK